MRAGLAVAVGVSLWIFATPARAHRLDEFLQATTLAVEADRVVMQLRLTPGVAVVGRVLADLDSDGDGVLSDGEKTAYAERVLRDLSLTVDGNRLGFGPVAAVFPTVEEMRAGLGEILLTCKVPLPPGGPERRLVFTNHHQSRIAVYLVNCLVPDDPGIRVLAQNRNADQSFYQLDWSIRRVPPK